MVGSGREEEGVLLGVKCCSVRSAPLVKEFDTLIPRTDLALNGFDPLSAGL